VQARVVTNIPVSLRFRSDEANLNRCLLGLYPQSDDVSLSFSGMSLAWIVSVYNHFQNLLADIWSMAVQSEWRRTSRVEHYIAGRLSLPEDDLVSRLAQASQPVASQKTWPGTRLGDGSLSRR